MKGFGETKKPHTIYGWDESVSQCFNICLIDIYYDAKGLPFLPNDCPLRELSFISTDGYVSSETIERYVEEQGC